MLMKTCRICDHKIEPFMSFGKMPIANGFLNKSEFEKEYFFEMKVSFCENCYMFQLDEQPDATMMFHENYAFFSSLSKYMQKHFKSFSHFVMELIPPSKENSFVIELGSNDGIMLEHFKNGNYRHLGIEPSSNVAKLALEKGINTISKFFDLNLADQIYSEYGLADAIICANVMCHIPNLNDIAKGIAKLLKPNGFLIFEDPYLGDMVRKVSYDQIYDEHVYIFSAHSVAKAFGRSGLELVDLIPQTTHGGSMRYVLGHKGAHKASSNVMRILEDELSLGLNQTVTFEKFKLNCEASRDKLRALLEEIRSKGEKVVGYGATSKSTTILNYCNLNADYISYISDTTPIKQNKYSPGMHIPVKSYDFFKSDASKYLLLFAWNHADEIFEKESKFSENGGKWIRFVPRVEII